MLKLKILVSASDCKKRYVQPLVVKEILFSKPFYITCAHSALKTWHVWCTCNYWTGNSTWQYITVERWEASSKGVVLTENLKMKVDQMLEHTNFRAKLKSASSELLGGTFLEVTTLVVSKIESWKWNSNLHLTELKLKKLVRMLAETSEQIISVPSVSRLSNPPDLGGGGRLGVGGVYVPITNHHTFSLSIFLFCFHNALMAFVG